MPSRADLRLIAVAAADAAGEVILAGAGGPAAAETKAEGDYVTEVDRAAERAALRVLRDRTPEIAVLAEESGGSRDEELLWVVDPLDGTTNFVRRFPVVGVSVALLEAGRPVVGAVTAPFTGDVWTAAEGEGAVDVHGHPLRVSSRHSAQVVSTGFPFREPRERMWRYLPVMEGALRRFEDLRRPGAASLDLAYAAAGTWDGFFELGLSIWDIAAGALLVREAGGVVTDWRGDPIAVFESGDILAGSPQWHEAMLGIVVAAHMDPASGA